PTHHISGDSSCSSTDVICCCYVNVLRRRRDCNYRLSFLMNPGPPRPTLFPYTTLFRSVSKASSIAPAMLGLSITKPSSVLRSKVDRKSTRLNSSHVKISYAVFCLKKKNIKDMEGNKQINNQYCAKSMGRHDCVQARDTS